MGLWTLNYVMTSYRVGLSKVSKVDKIKIKDLNDVKIDVLGKPGHVQSPHYPPVSD